MSSIPFFDYGHLATESGNYQAKLLSSVIATLKSERGKAEERIRDIDLHLEQLQKWAEQLTDVCPSCGGNGEIWYFSETDDGRRCKTCLECKGSGLQSEEQPC